MFPIRVFRVYSRLSSCLSTNSSQIRSGRGCSPATLSLDHVCGFFGDHDSWRVSVPADNRWHDGGVYHSHSFQSMHPQFGINYCHGTIAHLACSHGMVESFSHSPGKIAQCIVALSVVAGEKFTSAEFR